MNRKTYKLNDHLSKAEKNVDGLGGLKIIGLFSCDLKKGVAPFIQIEKKRGKIAILATHLLVLKNNAQQLEVDIDELPYKNRLANEWRLH